MAKFCSRCNKKFRFFEEDFDGICRGCYEKKIKQDEIEKQEIIRKQKEKIEKLERERRIEEEKRRKEQEQRRIEEERRLEEEQNKIEEERRLEEQRHQEKERIEEENKIKEEIKLEKSKIIEKEKKAEDFQEYLEKLKLERKIKVEEDKKKKEKIKQEKLKQKKLEQEKVEKNRKKLVIKLEKEQEQINKNLLNIFEDISLFIEHTKKIINIKKDIDLYILILKRIMLEIPKEFNDNTINNLRFKTKNNILEEFDENKDLCLFIYDEIVKLLQYNLLQKEINNFKNETELFKMYISLIKTIDDKEYIVNKIYTMYNNFYSNTFIKKKSKEDLRELMQIMNKESEYEKYRNDFLNNNKDIISMIPYIDDKSLTKFINLIERTDYFSKVDYIDIEEFAFMINSFLYKANIEEKIFTLENLSKIYEKLQKDLKKLKLIREKERLLNGDMTKEIEIQKQAVEYSNVQNGYEFEEYVANLYKKLGYTIEEITKKSGDQRCRCNRI